MVVDQIATTNGELLLEMDGLFSAIEDSLAIFIRPAKFHDIPDLVCLSSEFR